MYPNAGFSPLECIYDRRWSFSGSQHLQEGSYTPPGGVSRLKDGIRDVLEFLASRQAYGASELRN